MTDSNIVMCIDQPMLTGLATRIDAAVHDAELHALSAVDAALCAGRLLIEAKALLPHGQ